MVAGRPRITSFPPEEMIKLGIEMVAYVSSTPDILHLSEWYTIKKGFLYREWKTFIQKEEFLPYYEQALRIIGKKYVNGIVNASIAQRWQRVYFADLKEQEDSDADADVVRKQAVQKQATESDEARHKEMIDQLKEIQSSARTSACKTNKTDIKS